MSENLQRQAGITETTVGLTAKAQTPGELILEVMDGEMDASIHRTGFAKAREQTPLATIT